MLEFLSVEEHGRPFLGPVLSKSVAGSTGRAIFGHGTPALLGLQGTAGNPRNSLRRARWAVLRMCPAVWCIERRAYPDLRSGGLGVMEIEGGRF